MQKQFKGNYKSDGEGNMISFKYNDQAEKVDSIACDHNCKIHATLIVDEINIPCGKLLGLVGSKVIWYTISKCFTMVRLIIYACTCMCMAAGI